MLQEILRDQAVMLRSMADELDSVAAALEQQTTATANQTVGIPVYTGLTSYQPIPIRDVDDAPGDLTIAVPDGRVDVAYNMNPGPNSRINLDATRAMAEHDARQGKIVCLDFGDHKEFWTKETFASD